MMKRHKIQNMFQAEHSGNGRTVWLRFNAENDRQVELQFSTDMLRQIQHHISGVLEEAEAKSSLTAQQVLRAEGIARWSTAPAEGQNDVVLIQFRTGSGLVHNYALPSTDALGLSAGLAKAAHQSEISSGTVH
jgi:hypothetical protein